MLIIIITGGNFPVMSAYLYISSYALVWLHLKLLIFCWWSGDSWMLSNATCCNWDEAVTLSANDSCAIILTVEHKILKWNYMNHTIMLFRVKSNAFQKSIANFVMPPWSWVLQCLLVKASLTFPCCTQRCMFPSDHFSIANQWSSARSKPDSKQSCHKACAATSISDSLWLPS